MEWKNVIFGGAYELGRCKPRVSLGNMFSTSLSDSQSTQLHSKESFKQELKINKD